ncbi:hypothetical protein V8G54_027714 [Vigna mungo]|uniref:Uncharacterized protein n=1 Tax=Vigna mungo TaxID=3915 RepID=A0AAQ3RK83_VIGMU
MAMISLVIPFFYGTLNTVVLEFPSEVWDYVGEYFEATDARRNNRGHCFMFCNVRNAIGALALIALEVGKVAINGQSWSSSNHIKHALKDSVPDPVTYVVTD